MIATIIVNSRPKIGTPPENEMMNADSFEPSPVIDKMPDGPINVNDPKSFPPPKTSVLTKMEELIHHFIIHTEGIKAPAGEIYFGAENPKGELGFYINSRGGGVPHRMNWFVKMLDLLLARPHTVFMDGSGIAHWYASVEPPPAA